MAEKTRVAAALPVFNEFDVNSEPGTLAQRWKKWLTRFCNLMVAMDITDKARQRALLVHVGEATNEIFETLSDTEATRDQDPFKKAHEALTKYFTPKRNREYEIYVFRQAKQESNEGIICYHTRLRQLASTCEFESVEREIETQIVQNCLSHKLRMKALGNPDLTLSQLLEAGKAMEILKQKQQALNKVNRFVKSR